MKFQKGDMNFIPDKPIAFNRDFVSLDVGITGALMLSQAIYWSKRTESQDGWFYKTQAEWQEETGMTRREQETARKKLKNIGVLEETRAGLPATTFYRVNEQKLAELMGSNQDCTNVTNQNGGMRQTGVAESDKQEWRNAPNIHTENTTETTSENNTERGAREEKKETKLEWLERVKDKEEDVSDLSDRYQIKEKHIYEAADNAYHWLKANGRKKKDYRAFLINWLKREKEKNPDIEKTTHMKIT